MLDAATEAEILRLYLIEAWPIATIARQLRLHYSVVERVVHEPREARPTPVRSTMVDPYRPFILETLERWPDLTARRLFDMCVDRGYTGRPSHFREIVRRMRPVPSRKPEAFLRLRVRPGEQGQVDWAHFGNVTVGRARRQLLAFVMVLAWSRMIFLRFFLGGAMPAFLKGHVMAFRFFGGVTRCLLYDNLKSAVLERRGDAIRFHPTLIALAKHYSYEPRPVAVRRGNEKGRVERAIRFARDSFFGGRIWTNIDDLNRQAAEWCLGRAAERPWPDDQRRTVLEAYSEEQASLLKLPADDFPAEAVESVKIQKTPYARFEGNDYSVPHDFVMRTLSVAVSETHVRILDGAALLAVHERCYDSGQRIEKPEHLAALRDEKRKAERSRPADRLNRAAPSAEALLEEAAERGENLGAMTSRLLQLLDVFGGVRLESACQTALERGTPHPRSVQTILEADEQRKNALPPVAIDLPDDPRLRDLAVRQHELAGYDSLRSIDPQEGEPQADSSKEASDGE